MVDETIKNYSAIADDLSSVDKLQFFAILKMDELTDRWTFLFGLIDVADLDKRNLAFIDIRKKIMNHITPADMQDIARIGIFSTTDHLIEDLMIHPANKRLEGVKANGNFIHEGYILINRIAKASPRAK